MASELKYKYKRKKTWKNPYKIPTGLKKKLSKKLPKGLPKKLPKLSEKWMLLCILAAVAIVVGMVVYTFMPGREELELSKADYMLRLLPGLLTAGFERVELDVAFDDVQGAVALTSGCKRIVAYVEPHQAESIYRGIEGEFIARPNAHDIMVDAMKDFGMEVVMVKITKVEDNAFYGKLILKKGNKVAELDARPSDATAIAVRVGAPIYVKSELFETHGEEIC